MYRPRSRREDQAKQKAERERGRWRGPFGMLLIPKKVGWKYRVRTVITRPPLSHQQLLSLCCQPGTRKAPISRLGIAELTQTCSAQHDKKKGRCGAVCACFRVATQSRGFH